MKKKIPAKLSILGRSYKVVYASADVMKKQIGQGVEGAICFDQKKIYILDELSDEEKILTTIHECVHSIAHTIGLNQILDAGMQEVLCESVANGMHDLFKQIKQ